ncbi:MAG: pyrroline-5-carboxylate reductase [Sphaerochaetaceae bacterium]
MIKIGFIGCGNMGAAIAAALYTKKEYEVNVFEAVQSKQAEFIAAHPEVKGQSSLEDLFASSEILFIAVKPQILATLYTQLGKLGSVTKKWISIAAGVPLSVLCKKLGTDQVVRFMPNIAAKAHGAVTAIAVHPQADKLLGKEALSIAQSFGSAFFLDENLFPAFIGISGSAIAFIYQFIHALAMGGCKEGIPYPTSVKMVVDTMEGAVKLQKETQSNVVDLETFVCSAAGTTIDGVQALYEAGFDAAVMDAVVAATERARELEELAIEAEKNGK